jgi:hypothetical protein
VWAEAYLQQARSDWLMWQLIHELRRPPGMNLLKIVDLVQQQFYRLFT